MFSTIPPQHPPINRGNNNNNTGGGGNFRRGATGNGGSGNYSKSGNFRLRRPDPRGGGNFNIGGGGAGGRGGGRGGRGRGGGPDFDSNSGNRDFGLGGFNGGGGGGGGRNSPPSLNKKNIFGNPEPFITSEKGTRTNTVTIFPGNYDDADDGYSDDEDGFDMGGAGGDDNDDSDNDEDSSSPTMYDPAFVPDDPTEITEQKMLKEHLLKEQEKRERWIDTALPPERISMIDERGRSYGRGGRKRAQARVWIQPGLGEIIVNRRRFTDYFDRLYDREQVLAPFVATETCNMFDVQIMVKGGGLTGQAGAIRLGAARALNAYNPDLYRPPLKLLGYLTRDPRKVERKKVGKTKARKSPQWVRR